jgi:transcriptional regulator with XRE-family HTH domain
VPTKELRALGKRIAELRRLKKLTQSGLAERSGLSPNYIGKVERGEAQATIEALLAIADALKTSPANLFVYLDRPQSRDDIKRSIRDLLEKL